MKSQKIQINISYGSERQYELFSNMFRMIISMLSDKILSSHKKNKVNYEVEDQVDGVRTKVERL